MTDTALFRPSPPPGPARMPPFVATTLMAWLATVVVLGSRNGYATQTGTAPLPIALGDMAIGITAPWVLMALARRPGFASSAAFRAWNWFGVLDLIVAVSIGGLSAFLATGAAGEITTAPMTHMPLVLIPGFLVPLFLMLHAAALMPSRRTA